MNAIQYVRNAGRSLGYATIDVLKSYNPVVTESISQAKSLTEEVYQSIKDFKTNMSSSGDEDSFVGQAKDVVKDIWKSVKEDALSGNWYNKQRINANQEAAFNELMGGEDFNFDFDDDFGDLEFEDEDLESSTKEEISTEMQSARAIVGSVDAIAAKSVGALTNATIQSADHIATTQERSAKALYSLNERGFAAMSKGIGSISASMNVMQSLAEPLTTHMQNSAAFYTKSTEFQNKTLELLTKIEKGINPQEERRGSSSKKLTPDDLVTNGTLDLKNYFDFIKGNVKEYTDMVTSLLDMVGGVKGAGKMASGSPLSGLLTMAVEKMLPKVLKDNMKEFNEMFEGAVFTFLGGLKDKKLPGILDIFKDIFVPDFKFKDGFNVNRFQKGPLRWDGVARHALTQIIPLQLSKIVSALTGEDKTMFDYRTGRWRKLKYFRGETRQRIKSQFTNNDLNYEAKRVIEHQKSKGRISETHAKELTNSVDELMYTIGTSNSNKYYKIFDHNASKNDLKKIADELHTDLETINLLRKLIFSAEANGRRSLKTNYTGSVVKGRVNANRVMEEIAEEGGYGMATANGGYTEEDEKAENEGRKTGALGFAKDKYGNDIFFYLQGIYRSTRHVSENLEYLRTGSGAVNDSEDNVKARRFKPFKKIKIKNNNVNKTAGANKANAGAADNVAPGSVFDNLQEAINDTTNRLDIRFSTRELENYYRTKMNFRNAGNSENAWKANVQYNENLEAQLEKELKQGGWFKDLRDRLEDSRLNPLFKSISGMFDRIGTLLAAPADAMSGFYNSMSTSINNALYGENQKGGIMDWIKSAINDFRGTMRSILGVISNKLGIKLLGERDANGNFDSNKFFGRLVNQTKENLKGAFDRVKSHFGFAGGGVVTRTGIATVSRGEVIIPAGRGSRWADLSEEQKAFIDGQLADGVNFDDLSDKKREKYIDLANRYLNGKVSSNTRSKVFKRKKKIQNVADFAYQGGKKLADGFMAAIDRLFGNNPEKDMTEVQKKINEKSKKLLEGLDEGGAGGLGAGAILGTGVSILTGGLINPLLGAGLGAAAGFIKKSKTVQELLFGKEGDQTEMQKAMQTFFVDNLPGIAEGAGIGGTAGLFLGSPMLGSILGGAVGFVASSDKAKKYLFGDLDENGKRKGGLISKELQDKIKTSLPNIGAGAIAGLIAGPFGLAGNLILGSALGLASSTDGFKNWLFGEETTDENGNKTRKGGLLGKLREDIADPIVGIFQKLGEEMKHGFRNLAKGLKDSISKIFAKSVGKIRESRLGRRVLGFGNSVLNGAIGLVSRPLKGFNNFLEGRALRKGYGIRGKNGEYLDAFARQQMGTNHRGYAGSMGAKYDEFLAGADDDQIDLLLDNVEAIKKNGDFSALRDKNTRALLKFKRSISSHPTLTLEQKNAILKAAENGDIEKAKNLLSSYGIDRNRFADDFNAISSTRKDMDSAKSAYDALNKLTGGKVDIDDFKDLLTQEKAARGKLNEDQVKEREERRDHIINDVLPERLNDMISVLMHIANGDTIDGNSELGQRIKSYGQDVNSVFKDAKEREHEASNARAEETLEDILDGDSDAIEGAMNMRRGAQGLGLKIQMKFREITHGLKLGIGGMFSGLFNVTKSALGAVGNLFGKLFGGAKKGASVAGGALKGLWGGVKSGAKGLAKGFFKLFKGNSSSPVGGPAGAGSGLFDVGFADGGVVDEDGLFPLSEGEVVLPTTRNKGREKLTEIGNLIAGKLGNMFRGIPVIGTVSMDGIFAKKYPSIKFFKGFNNAPGEDDTDPGEVNVAEEGDKREEGGITQIFHNGGWIAKTDYEADVASKNALAVLPNKLGELSNFGKIYGESDEEKEEKKSFFENLMEGLFGKNGEQGFLNGIFNFFTGGKLGRGGAISKLLNSISGGRGFMGIILDMLPGVLGIAALSGALNKFANKIGELEIFNGDNNPENSPGVASSSAVTVGNTQVKTDDKGNIITDANGNFIGIDGSVVDPNGDVHYYGENNALDARAWRNIGTQTLRQLASGKSLAYSLSHGNMFSDAIRYTAGSKTVQNLGKMGSNAVKGLGRMGNNAVAGVKGFATKTWDNLAWKSVTKEMVDADTGARILEEGLERTTIGKAADKASGFIGKCAEAIKNFFYKVGEAIKKIPGMEKFCKKMGEESSELVIKGSTEASAKKAFLEGLKDATIVLYAIQLVGAGLNAIGNAPSYLQVTTPYQKLPFAAKFIAVVVNVVNNAIPYIGGLIPTRVFYNLFYKCAKAVGLDGSEWFKDWEQKRAEAKAEVEAFNQQNGYNFNIEQYNDYMHNNGVITDVSNEYRSELATLGNNFKSGGFGQTMKDIGTGFVETLKDEGAFNTLLYKPLTENIISSTISDRIDRSVEQGGIIATGYDKLMTGVGNVIVGTGDALGKAGNAIATGASNAWEATKSGASKAWNATKAGAANAWNGLTNAWDATKVGASKAWNATKAGAANAWEATKSGVFKAGNAIATGATNAWEATKSGAANLWNGIIGGVNEAKDKIAGSRFGKWTSSFASQFKRSADLFADAMHQGDLEKLGKTRDDIKADVATNAGEGQFTFMQGFISDLQYYMYVLPTALKGVGNAIGAKFEAAKLNLRTTIAKAENIKEDLFGPAFKGDVDAVANYQFPEDPDSPAGKTMSGIVESAKIVAVSVASIGNMFNKIKEKFNEVKTNIKTGFDNVKGVSKEVFSLAIKGDLEKFAKYEISDDPDNPLSGVSKSTVDTVMMFAAPIAYTTSTFNNIKNKLTEVKTNIKTGFNNVKSGASEIFSLATKGDLEKFANYNVNDDPNNPLGGVSKAALETIKFLTGPIAYTTSTFNKIKEKLTEVKTNINTGFNNVKNGASEIFSLAIQGNTEEVVNYDVDSDPNNPLGGVSKAALETIKFLTGPIAFISSTFNNIKSKVTETVDSSKGAVQLIKDTTPKMWELAKAGELEKINEYDISEAENLPAFGGVAGSILNVERLFFNGVATFTYAGISIKEKISDYIEGSKKGISKLEHNMELAKGYAEDGNVSAIWGDNDPETENPKKIDGPLSWVWNIGSFIGKAFYSVIGTFNAIGKGISNGISGIKNLFTGLGDLLDEALGINTSGSGSGIAGRGSNFVSQFDYDGMKMGSGESVAEAGCGPATAAMAARDAGIPLSMSAAVRASDNYQTTGGTDISYFGNTMGSMGIPTRTMTDKNQIYSALGGRGAILLGQDASNTTKRNSPFGPGAHYVYSPGTDKQGNIIVKDPEARGTRTYSPKILNNTIAAVGIGKGSRAPKYYHNINSKYSGKSTEGVTKEQIFAWLIKEMGFKDYQAAAVMGCWQAESGNRFRRIEGDPGDFDAIAYNRSSLTNYANVLFGKYANQGISISKSAYKASDGLYYVGLGLCQWTGPRAKRLFDIGESQGKKWTEPEVQLTMFKEEMNSKYRGTYSKTCETASIEDAVEVFGRGFEHGGIKKGTKLYNTRLAHAKTIFSQLANRPLADVSDLSAGTGGIDPRQKLVELATSQIGYYGRNKDAYDANPSDSSGYPKGPGKYNKYAEAGGGRNGENWCGNFVTWLYDEITDHDHEKYSTLMGQGINKAVNFPIVGFPESMRRYYKNGDVPEPGDVVAYTNNGSSGIAHTSIVASVDPSSGKFISIDGNYPNIVAKYSKPYNGDLDVSNQRVAWWARPNWEAAFPDGYFGSNSRDSLYSGGTDGSGEKSGNNFTDYLSGINTVFSEVFAKIFGKKDSESEEHEGLEGEGYEDSLYGDSSYGDSGYYGDSASAIIGNSKIPNGDQADTWKWDRKTAQVTPRSSSEAAVWAKAKTAEQKARVIAEWNGRYIPDFVKQNDTAATNMPESALIDWYMERSIPAHRSTGVYVIPNDYKKFSWKRGDAAKHNSPSMVGYTINSSQDAANWELVKKDPIRLFKLIANKYNRDYSGVTFPSGTALTEMSKSDSAIYNWMDSAMLNTIPNSSLKNSWINFKYSSPYDLKEWGQATSQHIGVDNSKTTYDPALDNGDGTTISTLDPSLAGSGSGLEELKKKRAAYDIKHLSGWGTRTQGNSGTNRPSKSVYVGRGTTDSYNIAPVSAPTQRISTDNAVLLKAIVTLIETLVKNTSQVDGIFEIVKTIAEQNGVSDAAMISALNNLKSNSNDLEPGLAELKRTVDSMLLA